VLHKKYYLQRSSALHTTNISLKHNYSRSFQSVHISNHMNFQFTKSTAVILNRVFCSLLYYRLRITLYVVEISSGSQASHSEMAVICEITVKTCASQIMGGSHYPRGPHYPDFPYNLRSNYIIKILNGK
jgi:hypothetical protein